MYKAVTADKIVVARKPLRRVKSSSYEYSEIHIRAPSTSKTFVISC